MHQRTVYRQLDWPGCVNVRDLGGLAISNGKGATRFRRVIRSDNPAYLSEDGWHALSAYGVRTIVALRTIGADDAEPTPRSGVSVVRVEIEDLTDAEFRERWGTTELWGTPLYFSDALRRWPMRCTAAVRAVADATVGGVVISCGRGCDRTGLLTTLLLATVGVSAADIADDWKLSIARVDMREPGYASKLAAILEREGATIEGTFEALFDGFDAADYLRGHGLPDESIAALRSRLLDDD